MCSVSVIFKEIRINDEFDDKRQIDLLEQYRFIGTLFRFSLLPFAIRPFFAAPSSETLFLVILLPFLSHVGHSSCQRNGRSLDRLKHEGGIAGCSQGNSTSGTSIRTRRLDAPFKTIDSWPPPRRPPLENGCSFVCSTVGRQTRKVRAEKLSR